MLQVSLFCAIHSCVPPSLCFERERCCVFLCAFLQPFCERKRPLSPPIVHNLPIIATSSCKTGRFLSRNALLQPRSGGNQPRPPPPPPRRPSFSHVGARHMACMLRWARASKAAALSCHGATCNLCKKHHVRPSLCDGGTMGAVRCCGTKLMGHLSTGELVVSPVPRTRLPTILSR